MFGKSAADIENYLLDTDTVDPEYCVSLLHCSLKKKASDVVEAVSGFNMTPEQKERVRIVQGHFADIDHRIAQLDEIIGNLIAEYEGQIYSQESPFLRKAFGKCKGELIVFQICSPWWFGVPIGRSL